MASPAEADAGAAARAAALHRALRHVVAPDLHRALDNLYAAYLRAPTGATEAQVHAELVRVCGHDAVSAAMRLAAGAGMVAGAAGAALGRENDMEEDDEGDRAGVHDGVDGDGDDVVGGAGRAVHNGGAGSAGLMAAAAPGNCGGGNFDNSPTIAAGTSRRYAGFGDDANSMVDNDEAGNDDNDNDENDHNDNDDDDDDDDEDDDASERRSPGTPGSHRARHALRNPRVNLEVSNETKDAWNHCVNCNNATNCPFPLCNDVRPYLDHIREVREDAIVGACFESCKFCAFYERMQKCIVRSPLDLTPRERKEQVKSARLIQQFAGLLLAHKDRNKNTGDPLIRQLYEHSMICKVAFCPFRNSTGSCRSSRKLMAHLQECKWKQTKHCALCKELPPKVRGFKRAPRSLPVPEYVREEIQARRVARQRQRRRERAAQKKLQSSDPQEDHYPIGLGGMSMGSPQQYPPTISNAPFSAPIHHFQQISISDGGAQSPLSKRKMDHIDASFPKRMRSEQHHVA